MNISHSVFLSSNFQQSNDENYDDYDYAQEEKGPALEIYGTDLTVLAQEGKLEECYGREKELLEMMEILVRRQKNNPVLVGDAGVGKTAIVELFANKIVKNLVPFVLEGRSIVSLDLARIVAGSRYRGEFELRFQRVLDEVLEQPHIIIFIDEIHNIGGTGSAEGSLDAANILKPVLSRSGFQCIGATTTKEYQRIEKDPALNRRFQPIKVKEPSIDETVHILYGIRPSLESFHNVDILPGALRLAAELSSRYIYDRFLPDKAIDLIDRASAKEVIRLTNVNQGSVVSALTNATLNNMGTLKLEAYRRGDVGAEYVLQEIENAYRNFLLRWIENPLMIPDASERPVLSPIAQEFFDRMRMSVLKRVDELLFASSNPRSVTKEMKKVKDLSAEKNYEIYGDIVYDINQRNTPTISMYRSSLFLFGEWLEGENFNFLKPLFKLRYFNDLRLIFKKIKMYDYVVKMRKKVGNNPVAVTITNDFCPRDVEYYEETFEMLNELESTRIEVFTDFITDLKPVLRKGLVASLKYSSQIRISDQELTAIYNLLGYFSTDTGREFLYNLEDPELIRRARKLGDFTGLKKRITQKEIRQLLADMTGIPMQSLSNAESQKLINLEATLHKRVIGQEEAISAIAKAIRRSRLGIQNPNRPIASFMFCGPTGVGKTEVTKALAVSMFGAESDMIRFDMSEFMEKFTVSRLIGSPPGYIGYDDGGQLTDAVRRKPYSVVLFDEVEKAHPDILNILLQILEDGRLTDSQKRLIPFENTVIIMTSNAAAEEIQQIIKAERASKPEQPKRSFIEDNSVEENSIPKTSALLPESSDDLASKKEITPYKDLYSGTLAFLESPVSDNFMSDLENQLVSSFVDSLSAKTATIEAQISQTKSSSNNKPDEKVSNLKGAVLERLSTMFLPEFLNRLDDIIIFQPLRPEELRKICDIMISEVAKRVESKQIFLSVDEKVKTKLTREGYNPLFGARPLRRLVTKYIEDLISETILQGPSVTKTRNIQIQLNEDDQVVVKN